jgi:hypothetical protein
VKIAGLTGEFDVLRLAVSVEENRFNWLLLDIIVGFLIFVGAIALYFQIRKSRRTRLAMLAEDSTTDWNESAFPPEKGSDPSFKE